MSGKEVRPVVRCLLFSSALCCLEETEFASLFCSSSASVRCIATPQWMEFFAGIDFAGISNKQLALSLVRRRPSRSFLVLAAAEVVVVRRGRRGWLESADRARAHSRWSFPGYGAGACNRGRWPVVAGIPPYFLAEGRLSSFLLAMEPLGRQSSCWSKAMASGHGSLVAPSGEVPGDGEVMLDRELRTRSLFSFQFGVLHAKVQGLVVLFSFIRVLFVKCVVYLLDE